MPKDPPVFPEARRFQELTDFAEKKSIVHPIELAIQGGELKLDPEKRGRCARSDWHLDRIVLYLAEEYDSAPPDYKRRLLRVQQEFEKLGALRYEGSLMPLSYALGSFEAMLQARPHFASKVRSDRSLFDRISRELTQHSHLDEGGQVKVRLANLMAATADSPSPPRPRSDNEPSTSPAPPRERMELWKQIVITLGAIIVALIGVWQASKTNAGARPSAPVQPVAVDSSADTSFIAHHSYPPEQIQRVEYDLERAAAADSSFLDISRVRLGSIGNDRGFSIDLVLRNSGAGPMGLELKRQFFSLEDDQGRAATLVRFCCEARGALLSPGGTRTINLVFRAPSGWFAKDGAPDALFVRVRGLLPLVRAAWSFQPPRMAA